MSTDREPSLQDLEAALRDHKLTPREEQIMRSVVRSFTYSVVGGCFAGIGAAYYVSKTRGFTGGKKVGAYIALSMFGTYTGAMLGISLSVKGLEELKSEPIWDAMTAMMRAKAQEGAARRILDPHTAPELPPAARPTTPFKGVAPLPGVFGPNPGNGAGSFGPTTPSIGPNLGSAAGPFRPATPNPAHSTEPAPKFNKWGDKIE